MGANAETVISVRGVTAGYNGSIVLEEANLEVKRLDFVGLIGPNGGGKTTLLKVIMGLITPVRGEVRLLGRTVEEGRRFVGYVPQTVQFDHDFPVRVWDVVRMGRLGRRGLFHRYSTEDDTRVAEALQRVEMLDMRDSSIGELSGGQRQRVYVARALAAEPQVLLLDEPTASLDPRISTNLYELLLDLNQQMTILMVSHDMPAISAYVKTVGCINRRLIYHGEGEFTDDMAETAYHCPLDLIRRRVGHDVYSSHDQEMTG